MAKGLLVVGKEVQGGGVLAAYMLYFHPQGGGGSRNLNLVMPTNSDSSSDHTQSINLFSWIRYKNLCACFIGYVLQALISCVCYKLFFPLGRLGLTVSSRRG